MTRPFHVYYDCCVSCLTVYPVLCTGAVIDASTFEELYKCWKENEVEVETLLTHLANLDANEGLLVMSNMIKSSYGMGRMGLTHKRLGSRT